MTRDELIEAMARAILPVCRDAFAVECLGPNSACEHGSCGCSDIAFAAAETALSVIEAVACVVPKDATEDQLESAIAAMRKPRMRLNYTPADDRVTLCVAFKAMTEASPFRSKP